MVFDRVFVLAERQHGAVSCAQLREIGLPREAIRHMVRSGQWRAGTDEVLVRVGSPSTHAQRVMVPVLDAGPATYLSHESAANWWGLTGCRLDPVTVVRTSSTRRRDPLAIVRQVRSVPGNWTTTLESIPIVRPELVALHLHATCSIDRAERLVDRLWSLRLLSGGSILRFLDEHAASGRNGITGLRDYVAVRGPSYVPPASGIESRFMQLMRSRQIAMRRQVDSGSDNWTGRVDFRHLRLPLIVEIQSERYHSALTDVEEDRRRINQLLDDGYSVVEITDALLFSDAAKVVGRVRDGIRSAELGATPETLALSGRTVAGGTVLPDKTWS